MTVIRHRNGLKQTAKALKTKNITIGFIGGSITSGSAGWNWPEPVCAWFQKTYPNVRVHVENAAIGATGSDLAVFRAERDLLSRGCDLIFIEFAVNDEGVPAERRMRSREGLVRKLLKAGESDLVFTYTYSQGMYQDMVQGKVPSSIAEFETLAGHYSIGSVWMGLQAFQEVQQGGMRWEEWLPDGLHPQFRGSFTYAQSVIQFLQEELNAGPNAAVPISGKRLVKPLNSRCWEKTARLPFSEVQVDGAWLVQRWTKTVWIDQVLHTSSPGASLSFKFRGRGLVLGFDFGKTSAEFRYKIDDGKWLMSNRDHPVWCGNEGWFRPFVAADDLPAGKHTFTLEVVHGNAANDPALAQGFTGTNLNLALIGVLQ